MVRRVSPRTVVMIEAIRAGLDVMEYREMPVYSLRVWWHGVEIQGGLA